MLSRICRRAVSAAALLIPIVVAAGCEAGDEASPEPTPTSTNTPTRRPTATATATVTPSGTATPTPTPTPTATLTPSPPPPPTSTSTPLPDEGVRYQIQPGDTLAEVAARFDVPVETIAAANDIADPSLVALGEVLFIPGATPPPPTATPAPRSIDLLTVVDKQRGLPASYVPPGLVALDRSWTAPGFPNQSLRSETADALVRMLRDARAQGLTIAVRSSYRSYEVQRETFAYWVERLGREEALRQSAPPGHSEHQLGTTVDVTSASIDWQLAQSFGETASGRWLAENARRYGFALSYPRGAEAVTGYIYEPWHFRYIGPEHARAWRAGGQVLVRYLEGLG